MSSDRKYQIKETLRERVFVLVEKRKKPALYKKGKQIGKEKKDSDGNTIFTQWSKEDFYEDFSQKYGCKYDTVKAWFTKKNMPDYSDIINIAEYFSVSVDYLIGKTDIESTITADLASNYTGLNINAINLLHDYYRGNQWQLNTIDAINFLLEREETANILTNIYYYFFGNYTHTGDNKKTIPLMDENGYGVELIISEMQRPTFLNYITIGLTEAYKDYVKDNPQYKDYGKPTEKNYVMRCVNGRLGTKLERLNSVRDEIKQELKKHENQLDKFKKTNCNDMIEFYNSLVKNDTECLEIVESMIKKL